MASSIPFFLEKKCPLVGAELNFSCPLLLFIKPVDGSKKFLKSLFTFGLILNVKPFSNTPIVNEYFLEKTNPNQQHKHLYGSFLLLYISTY